LRGTSESSVRGRSRPGLSFFDGRSHLGVIGTQSFRRVL
jgi:hypothetical protein